MSEVKRENPDSEVGLWSQDEARFGLQPIIKKRWAKRGSHPIAEVNPRYEWTWSYGAVEMATGESFFLILPNLQAVSVEIFLREFARFHSLEREDRHCAVGRRTGTSGKVKDSRRNRIISNSGTYAGTESE